MLRNGTAPNALLIPADEDLMNLTVLIADDDPVQRRLLEAMVRRFGYAVRVVDGGEAALRELEGAPVDLLILDRSEELV